MRRLALPASPRRLVVSIVGAPTVGLLAAAMLIAAPARPEDLTTADPAPAIDPARRTVWNPGILVDGQLSLPLGVDKLPVRTTVCSSPNPGDNLNTAIASCPAGQVVQLKAATYTVDYTIVLNKGVVLRGMGSQGASGGGTTIVRTGGGSVISIGTSRDGACYTWGSYSEAASPLSADVAKGSTVIPLGANASRFRAGDFALVDQVDDASLQASTDCPYFKRVVDPVARSIAQRVEVASVNTAQGTVTLTTPLHWSFRIANPYRAEMTRVTAGVTKWAGVEKLLLQGGSNPGYNGQMAGGIDISNAAYCWVKDVQTDGSIAGMHVALRGAYRCVVRDSFVHHSANYGFGTDCYGIVVGCGSADTLVENNIVRYMNKPLQFSASGGGNVLGYNYADNAWATPAAFQEVPVDSHCSYPHMELVEGNWAPHMATPDTHGGTGYVTFLRNYASSQFAYPPVYGSTQQQTGNVQAVGFCPTCSYMNVVGNVLGPAAGSDPRSAVPIEDYVCQNGAMGVCIYSFGDGGTAEISYQTAFLHGNYDTVNAAVIWDPGDSDHQIPASLYLPGRPAWWPAGLAWPWAGPDLNPMVGTLPAKARSDAGQNPPVALSVADVTLIEGNAGTQQAVFAVSLSASSALPVSVSWATADLTASAPADYTAASGTLAFPAGTTSRTVTVVVNGDTLQEADEQFRVLLASPGNATIADGEGIGAIVDDEGALLLPQALALSPLNQGVLRLGDTVSVGPTWRNAGSQASGSLTGSATLAGGGSLGDAHASYGVVAPGGTANCSSDCYALTVSGARPGSHWDLRLSETLNEPASHEWLLHVGDSFSDVPRTSVYFRFVEALLHKGVSGGCSTSTYCPASLATREQMAVFLLASKEGPGYRPPACGTPVFPDVPASSPLCRFIEELARRGVTGGCGGGNFCPAGVVSREQMAVFLLRTLDPALSPPPCGTPLFADVPASSPFCRWIEELARRGITGGCGGGSFCPTSSVSREQMAVLLVTTFGLALYGP